MPTTSNFGWTTPADTDLVKDGAAAIRTLGNGIDTSLVDLKGGTTGQVLSKASNTDLDFTWSSVDPLTILDAKGDLISATAADTPARLAVGADGTYLQADSTTSTGLKWGSVSAGGITLLSTTTLSGASTTVSSISGAYTHLFINIYGVSNSTADGVFRMWANGTTNIANHTRENFSSGQFNSVINDKILLLPSSTTILRTDTNNAFSVMIYNYSSTSQIKPISGSGMFYDPTNGSSLGAFLSGGIKTTSAITSLSFENTGGNWAGGTVLIYGVK